MKEQTVKKVGVIKGSVGKGKGKQGGAPPWKEGDEEKEKVPVREAKEERRELKFANPASSSKKKKEPKTAQSRLCGRECSKKEKICDGECRQPEGHAGKCFRGRHLKELMIQRALEIAEQNEKKQKMSREVRGSKGR